MKQTTESLIRAILSGDNTVTEDQTEKVLRACKQPQDHRSLIGPKEAMAILGVSRPTLRAYVKPQPQARLELRLLLGLELLIQVPPVILEHQVILVAPVVLQEVLILPRLHRLLVCRLGRLRQVDMTQVENMVQFC